jgi:hypothetical protein
MAAWQNSKPVISFLKVPMQRPLWDWWARMVNGDWRFASTNVPFRIKTPNDG